jgi:hypothetical protein
MDLETLSPGPVGYEIVLGDGSIGAKHPFL